jgi:hypothetical protein
VAARRGLKVSAVQARRRDAEREAPAASGGDGGETAEEIA